MDNKIKNILQTAKIIAVVGLSDKPDRPSHSVASYLKEHGYKIIPVNPLIESVFGLKSYPNLLSIPEKIDVVDIFRKPEFVPEIVQEALKIGVKVIWMQEGVINQEAKKMAEEAGLTVIMDKCMMKEHKRFVV